jgi:cell wall-associated protease
MESEMKKLTTAALGLMVTLTPVYAAKIAIVDSGNDFEHSQLKPKAWINPTEIASNDRDEDRNGYPDDVNGWNFAESNNMLIDYSYAWSDTPDVRRFFEIQLKSFLGTLTKEDRDWANAKIKEEKFIKDITVFGNWMHGTHVTGIAARMSDEASMMGAKLIPTEVKLPGQKSNSFFIKNKNQTIELNLSTEKGAKDFLIKKAIDLLAKSQSTVYGEIGSYINGHKVDVMNGSFGTSYDQISQVLKMLIEAISRKPPTDEEVKNYTNYFFSVALKESEVFLKSAPKTLFVFAAGNEGSDNDVRPASPTNVVGSNKISVAATLGDQALANFSNYGAKNVEVAAPGVGIISTSPNNGSIPVSGTSQAAPYVAGVAGAVKDANPNLDVTSIKRIVLETVDVKPWLKGKVSTSGMVNAERAKRAAELSRSMDLSKAIAQARVDVIEKKTSDRGMKYYQIPKAFVTPMPQMIIVK